jgi:tol-pal system protein YbgF
VLLILTSVVVGCAANSDNVKRENEELRRLLTETRADLEAVKRDQEQLRATVEFLDHSRGLASGSGAADRRPAEPARDQWPADPWSSPDPFEFGQPPRDFDSLEPGAPGSSAVSPPPSAPDAMARGQEDAPQEPRMAPPERAPEPGTSGIVASVRGSGTHPEPGSIGIETPPPSVPQNLRGSLYEQGVDAFAAKDYDVAIQHFRDYIHKEPQSPYADDAQFWIGESNLRKGLYSNAIKEFNQVVLRYASGDRSAASLLKLAEVFSKIGDRVDARLSLQKLVNRYPGSAEAAEAYRLLQEMGG